MHTREVPDAIRATTICDVIDYSVDGLLFGLLE